MATFFDIIQFELIIINSLKDIPMKRVCYLYPPAYHYRSPFNERLRELLSQDHIEYTVIYSDLGLKNRFKDDTVEIPWGIKVPITRLPWGLEYQHALRHLSSFDLIIIQQENKLLLNYVIFILSVLKIKKVAFFGHGKNFQSRNPDGLGERFKRFWATKVDWWFGYTEETRRHVEALGFKSENITVFNNAVDTGRVRDQIRNISFERLKERRLELNIDSDNIGVFVGSLYPDRRVEFLVEAADIVRSIMPDFTLILAGGGSDLKLIDKLAASRPWIKVLGPRFDADKIELMMLGKLFLMPGLVGLAIVDAGAAGLPTITTAFPYHSPEIAYIENGQNGIIVKDWEDTQAYAEAIIDLLRDNTRRMAMSASARAMADRISIETMADRFAHGVRTALRA